MRKLLTFEDHSTERVTGDDWSTGPYVLAEEREDWNRLYLAFASEIALLDERYGDNVLTDEQIHTMAWNLAYQAIWEAR